LVQAAQRSRWVHVPDSHVSVGDESFLQLTP